MYVLGIETSCDETAASVVRNGRKVLSTVVSSSLSFHRKYGGIIPEIASRMHLETIVGVTDDALKQAGIPLQRVGLIAVTEGPGLLGSLITGISFAKAISLTSGIPLLGINHLQGHMYSSYLEEESFSCPCISLVVSGGHTALFLVRDFHRVRLIGTTQDDACGEAFDKVAKILGLGYPGGPAIEKLSAEGNPAKFKFNCSDTQHALDFSFSGIKTAVLYVSKKRNPLSVEEKRNIAASFQETVITVLIKKSLMACSKYGINRLVIGGGVAANSRLRARLKEECRRARVRLHLPSKAFCMDNAAMIAGLGYQLYKKGHVSDLYLNVAAG